jgi:hypothetical protein
MLTRIKKAIMPWFNYERTKKTTRALLINFEDGTRAKWTPQADITAAESAQFTKAIFFALSSYEARKSEWEGLERHLKYLERISNTPGHAQ